MRRTGWKRGADVVLGLIGAQLFAPLQLVAGALICVEDGGPVFFRQERVGRRRRPFTLLKLRTMRDGRVTRVGTWLRATGLDETPQFLNVLRGDMSVVGPRPLTAADVARLGWDRAERDARFGVRPGITGLAQLFAGRSARHSRALDALYARRSSPGLDLWLVAVSFAVNVRGKARVRGLLDRARRRRRARSRRARAAAAPSPPEGAPRVLG
jgi:lipopolysaccharide/colanic/teichoic acid biosynthesis glycosyltransferase